MLTSDKAICEMNTGELAEEYEYCMKSAESEALAPDLQRYFRDRASVIKKYMDNAESTFTSQQSLTILQSAESIRARIDQEKDQGKISPWFFYFVCKILSKIVMQ